MSKRQENYLFLYNSGQDNFCPWIWNVLPLCLAEGDIKQINADSTIPSEEDVRFAGKLSQISVCSHREPFVLEIGKTIIANGWSH